MSVVRSTAQIASRSERAVPMRRSPGEQCAMNSLAESAATAGSVTWRSSSLEAASVFGERPSFAMRASIRPLSTMTERR